MVAVPGMILGETALSFPGLGIRPPAVSWGTLLQDAQNVHTMVLYPWLLLPSLLVVVAVLMFNFSATACATPPTPTSNRTANFVPAASLAAPEAAVVCCRGREATAPPGWRPT